MKNTSMSTKQGVYSLNKTNNNVNKRKMVRFVLALAKISLLYTYFMTKCKQSKLFYDLHKQSKIFKSL